MRDRAGRRVTPGHVRRFAAGAAMTALLTVSACSQEQEPTPTSDDAQTTTAPTAADRLEQARIVLTEAGAVHLTMTGANLPEETDAYIIGAVGDGTMDPPAFQGTITAKVRGIQADVPTVAVNDELHVKLPFTPGYITTAPEDLGVPDPAKLFDVETGLVSLLTKTVAPTFGQETRVGREVVLQVTGSLPGDVVVDLLYVGDRSAMFDVTYGLVQESWQVRTVQITGPFYPPTTSTYALTLDTYGKAVTITAP